MPKIIDSDKKITEIVWVAIELFAKKGFENTTIQEIADAAGIGKSTIYYYFKNKNEILILASKEVFDEIGTVFGTELLNIPGPVETLSSLICSLLKVNKKIEKIFIIYMELWIFSLRDNNYGNLMETLGGMLVEMRNFIASIIEDGKKKKVFRQDIDSNMTAIYLTASLDGIMLHYMFDKSAFNIERVGLEFVNNMLKGLTPIRTNKG